MKFTRREYETIRDALRFAVEQKRGDIPTAEHLLDAQFPFIPPARTISRPLPAKYTETQIQAAADDLEPNARIASGREGEIFVEARNKPPFKFYVVEAFHDHAQAALFVRQLLLDDVMRRDAIREARDFDFYKQKWHDKQQRQPREKIEPVNFAFDP